MRHEEEEKNSCGWEEEGGASSTAKLLAQAVNIFTQQVKALRILIQLGHLRMNINFVAVVLFGPIPLSSQLPFFSNQCTFLNFFLAFPLFV
jgi:hypothetical protein